MESTTNGATVIDERDVTTPAIRLRPLEIAKVIVPVEGITPVIPHKWSEKALGLMREAQSGSKVRAKKEPKDPVAEAEGACYYLPDGVTPGMPATSFKAAIVDAVRFFEGLTMVQAKQSFFVEGEGPDQLVELRGERHIREDTPRNANGIADLRYRYAYFPWEADLPVSYMPGMIDLESVIALVNAAGLGGVGDWRPSAPKSKTGTFGRFEVVGSNVRFAGEA